MTCVFLLEEDLLESEIDQPPFVAQLPERPPFRIRTAHFFLLTTVCAAMATLRISWVSWQEVPAGDVQFFKLQIGLAATLLGVALTGVLILLGRRWRYGRSELKFPGHWLLLFMAIGALSQGLVEILLEFYRFYASSPDVDFYVWNLEKLLLCSTVGITSLIFAWLIPGNVWWKALLAVSGVILLVLVPQHLLVLQGAWHSWFPLAHIYASLVVSAAIVPILILACMSDARRHLQRDCLHWTGVLVVAIAAVGEFGSAAYLLWKS